MLEPTSGNTGISLAMICRVRGYRMRAVMPESATPERADSLRMYGAEIVWSPGELGSNGAVAMARELAAADPDVYMPFQYANPANPDAHYRTTGPEIVDALDGRVDAFVAGLGTGGTLMGTGQALREANPRSRSIAAEPLQGDAVMGLRSLEDGYTPEILDVSKLDRRLLVSNAEALVGLRALLDREGIWAGVSAGAVVEVARTRGRLDGARPERRLPARRRRLEVRLGRPLEPRRGRARRRHGGPSLVVADAPLQLPRRDCRRDRRARARRASRRGVRDRLRRRRHGDAVPSGGQRRREPVPLLDRPVATCCGSSPTSTTPRRTCSRSTTRTRARRRFPSRTDVELAFWPDAAYLIVSLASDPPDLKAFTIRDGRIAKRDLAIT